MPLLSFRRNKGYAARIVIYKAIYELNKITVQAGESIRKESLCVLQK